MGCRVERKGGAGLVDVCALPSTRGCLYGCGGVDAAARFSTPSTTKSEPSGDPEGGAGLRAGGILFVLVKGWQQARPSHLLPTPLAAVAKPWPRRRQPHRPRRGARRWAGQVGRRRQREDARHTRGAGRAERVSDAGAAAAAAAPACKAMAWVAGLTQRRQIKT